MEIKGKRLHLKTMFIYMHESTLLFLQIVHGILQNESLYCKMWCVWSFVFQYYWVKTHFFIVPTENKAANQDLNVGYYHRIICLLLFYFLSSALAIKTCILYFKQVSMTQTFIYICIVSLWSAVIMRECLLRRVYSGLKKTKIKFTDTIIYNNFIESAYKPCICNMY